MTFQWCNTNVTLQALVLLVPDLRELSSHYAKLALLS